MGAHHLHEAVGRMCGGVCLTASVGELGLFVTVELLQDGLTPLQRLPWPALDRPHLDGRPVAVLCRFLGKRQAGREFEHHLTEYEEGRRDDLPPMP